MPSYGRPCQNHTFLFREKPRVNSAKGSGTKCRNYCTNGGRPGPAAFATKREEKVLPFATKWEVKGERRPGSLHIAAFARKWEVKGGRAPFT